MTSDQPPADLPMARERDAEFDYGFRMKCDCGGLSDLSAAAYIQRVSVDAVMPCAHCPASIHYGPAVVGIRDEHDPALDNAAVPRFAWYHSSTTPDWPSPDYADTVAAQLQNAERLAGYQPEHFLAHETGKALHVGTYEAAVENMLRRMHDQDDATSQFYLHRVTLTLDAERIIEGYWDENLKPAAQLRLSDLRAKGLDAIRYLNVYEAAGALSLAIDPRVIRSVQTMQLPIGQMTAPPSAGLSQRLRELESEDDSLRARAAQLDREEGHMRPKGFFQPDPTGAGARASAVEQQRRQLRERVFDTLTASYLNGISPLVQQHFCDALRNWQGETEASVSGLAAFFAGQAAVLTQASTVMRLLAASETRTVRTAGTGP